MLETQRYIISYWSCWPGIQIGDLALARATQRRSRLILSLRMWTGMTWWTNAYRLLIAQQLSVLLFCDVNFGLLIFNVVFRKGAQIRVISMKNLPKNNQHLHLCMPSSAHRTKPNSKGSLGLVSLFFLAVALITTCFDSQVATWADIWKAPYTIHF